MKSTDLDGMPLHGITDVDELCLPIPPLSHQFLHGNADGAQGNLVQRAFANDHRRPRGDQSLQSGETNENDGGCHLQKEKRDHGDQRMGNGNIGVGDGERCDFGENQRGHKVGNLQLPDLPLAHEPHRGDQNQIDQKCSEKDRDHSGILLFETLFVIFSFFQKNMQKNKKRG